MSERGTAVLIVAAGRSTRMGDFKPLMKLGVSTVIEQTLNTFGTISATHTVIITGHRSGEIENHFGGRGIVFIKNTHYDTTDMLCSVKLGLSYLNGKCDKVFIMPADIPLATPYCVEEMLAAMQAGGFAILKPTYKGKGGHPILIGAECFEHILAYEREGGLKGAMSSAKQDVCTLPLPEPGILMDADTPENFVQVKAYYEARGLPSADQAMYILEWNGVGEDIVKHCAAVEKLAAELAQAASRKGFSVDIRLVQAAALLHDVERKTGADHAQQASELLTRLEYPKVAWVVGEHMELSEQAIEGLDERAIVYLADKLVAGDKRVTIAGRRKTMLDKFSGNKAAADAINKRFDDARKVLDRLDLDDVQIVKL